MSTLASYVGQRIVAQPIITVSTLTVTSTVVSLGSNTSQTKNNFSGGSYTTGWLSTLTGVTSTVKVSMNQNGPLQTAVCAGTSTINVTSNSGVSWTTLTGANGLPAGANAWSSAGTPAYTHFSQSATGQYQLASVSGGLVYTSANYGKTWAPAGSYMGTPTYYIPCDGSVADTTGNSMPLVTGSVTYVGGVPSTSAAYNGVNSKNAVNLVNTAGGQANNFIRGTIPVLSNFTISCNVNLQTLPASNTVASVFTIGSSIQTFIAFQYVNNVTYNATAYTGLMFYFINSVNNPVVVGNYAAATTNTWYNLQATFSTTGTCSFYVNGVLIGTAGGAALLNTMTMYSVGTLCHATSTYAFNGYVDDVRIYNTSPAMNAIPPTVYLPLNGATTDVMGNTVTASSGITYGTGQVGSQSMYLANSAGTAASKFLTIPITLGTSQSFTVSLWFNASAISGNNILFEVGTTGAVGVNLYITSTGILTTTSYANNATWYGYSSTLTIVPNTWYLATYVYNYNSTSYVYINNAVAISFTPTVPLYAAPTILAIGAAAYSGNGSSFNGYIDDFRYYNAVVQPTPMIPQNYAYTAMSGTGQYQLVAANTKNAQDGLFLSTNYGLTWGPITAAQGTTNYTGLAMSNSGQHMIALGGALVTPQQSSLAAATWTQSGVTWTATASSLYNTYQAYFAFNNAPTASWNSNLGYNAVTGAYGGSTSTTILGGVGATTGEWLQIQSSVPLVMSSYNLACGGWWQLPKTYFIAGSNDNVNWYPIQSGTFNANPYTTNYAGSSNYIQINNASAQTFVGNTATTVSTVIYPAYTTQAYTYFRIICPTMCGNPAGTNASNNDSMSIGDWYINFLSGQSYSTNYGISWAPALTYGGDAFNIVKNVNVTNATNYYTLPPFTPLSTGITLSCWFVLNGTPALNARIFEMSMTPSKGADADTILMEFNTGTQLLCQQIVGSGSGTRYNTQSPTSLSNNQLYHAVWTIDGSGNNVLYLNGVSNATSTRVINVQNYPYFYLGHSTWTTDPASNINFVDFRMYNRALSAGEVTTLYQTNTNMTNSTYAAVSGNGQYTLLLSRQTANLVTSMAGLATETFTPLALPGINANIMCGSLSATGQYIVITTMGTTNNVYYSTNYGGVFTALTVGAAAMTSCAIAYDGSYLTVSNATTVYTLNLNSAGYTVVVGNQAGQVNQALNAIAIGNQAGTTNQSANSIVLNATGSALNAYDSGFFVGPVATASTSSQSTVSILGYGADAQVLQIPGLSSNPSGYVGIGTTNPLVAMHVYTPGTLNSTNNSLMSEVRICTDDNQIARVGCYEEPKGTTWGGWMQYNGANVINGADLLQFGGRRSGIDKTYMSIGMNNGFVGIGTIAPATALHVNGALYLTSNPSNPGNTVSASFWNQSGIGPTISGAQFQVQVSGTSTAFAINSAGQVGIGTVTPTAPLTIVSAANGGTSAESTSASATNLRIVRAPPSSGMYAGQYVGKITFSAADYSWSPQKVGAEISALTNYVDYSGAACDLLFSTLNATSDANPTERMRIKAGGNVGIGKTNPTNSLDVAGGITASSTIIAPYWYAHDQRGVTNYFKPISQPASTVTFGFFGNGGSTNGWGDGIHFNTYVDGSGGSQNLVLFAKGGIGMRIYQGGFQSTTAYSAYMDAVMMNSSGQVGIGAATPGYTLHVVGTIYATGDITAFSDQRFKQNIQPLDGALAKILRLTGYSYTRDDYRVGEKQIGLLAQEVQDVYPEAVLYDEAADKYSLNYSVMVAPLIQSMKEMHSLIKYQSTTIALLSKRVDDMETFIATMM